MDLLSVYTVALNRPVVMTIRARCCLSKFSHNLLFIRMKPYLSKNGLSLRYFVMLIPFCSSLSRYASATHRLSHCLFVCLFLLFLKSVGLLFFVMHPQHSDFDLSIIYLTRFFVYASSFKSGLIIRFNTVLLSVNYLTLPSK